MYDMNSGKVLQKNFISAVTLDTKSFAKGIYIYELKSKNGFLRKGKTVKY
jgi:hypothetical protein